MKVNSEKIFSYLKNFQEDTLKIIQEFKEIIK
ncbi:MAG: hypothetical protein ACQERB_06495 [Promethearchaeati archaeon]